MKKLALLIVLLGLGIAPLFSQYTTASLGGTVVDPSGAAVPGAKVTVLNQDTGLTKTAVSGSGGAFLFPVLPIGNYTLTVEKTGFTTYVQKGITLGVNQAATQTVKLNVGQVSQAITVSANAAMVTTRTATLSQLVDQRRIVDLPLNGRQPQALLFLSPGAVNETGKYCLVNCQGGVYPGEQDANVSGGGNRQVTYQMDGGDYNDSYLNTNLPFPNPDAIQEFSVQYNNPSAQYGMGDAVVNIVTKSGTNQIHGDAFEFVRNGALNARNFFAPTQDTLKRNQYGGTIGGPIVKDQLFFFGTYQGTPIRQAATGNIGFVPTAAERSGDFSAISTKLVNPATGAPFPNNQIPTSMFSPPSTYLLQHIPQSNGPNGQLTYTGPSLVQNDNQWMTKINWTHAKNMLTGSYFWTRFNEPPDTAIGNANLLAVDGGGNRVLIQTLSLNDTYSFSPSLLFNTWFGWNQQTGGSLSGAPFGFPAAGISIAAPTPPELSLSIPGFFSVQSNHFGDFDRGDYSIQEDVSLQRGAHELHFGGEAIRLKNHITNDFTMSGEFTFGNALSGNNLSDFMLGHASEFLQGGGEFKDMVGTLWSFYAQDNWRASRNLTVNLGLRWDPFIPYTELKGRVVCYVPGGKSQRYPNAPVGMLFGGSNHDPGCPAGGANDNLSNYAPRAGFAYKVGQSGSTVIRGGAGIYYTPVATHDLNGFVDTAPFGPRFDFVGDVNFQNPYASVGIPNPFPQQYGPTVPGSSATFTLPVSIYAALPLDYQLPRTFTWNVTIERQLGKDWLVRAGYLGNTATHLSSNTLAFLQANPAVYIPGQSTEANTQQRRINPNFGSVGLFASDYHQNYNALQLDLEKRFGRGISLTANYTWSKMMDDLGSSTPSTDPFNREFDYGPSNDDVPNVVNFSAVWQVPTSHFRGLAGGFINGWQLTSIATWRSGFPFSVRSGVDHSFSGVGADRANFVGTSLADARLDPSRPHGQLIGEYFNTAVFVPNTVGTFGDSGKNILFGPGFFDTDFGLLKNISITERARLQFRAEFFNLFNSVNFNQPNSSLNSSSFGRITSAGSPRILQFALKLLF